MTTSSFGEAELGTFRNLREPDELWLSLCDSGTRPGRARCKSTREPFVMKRHWVKDRLEAFLGTVVADEFVGNAYGERQTDRSTLAAAGLPSQRAPLLQGWANRSWK